METEQYLYKKNKCHSSGLKLSNRLYFMENEEKYDLFRKLNGYLLSSRDSERDHQLNDEGKSNLIDESFTGGHPEPEDKGCLYFEKQMSRFLWGNGLTMNVVCNWRSSGLTNATAVTIVCVLGVVLVVGVNNVNKMTTQ